MKCGKATLSTELSSHLCNSLAVGASEFVWVCPIPNAQGGKHIWTSRTKTNCFWTWDIQKLSSRLTEWNVFQTYSTPSMHHFEKVLGKLWFIF
jgi:hypothetical protein